MIRNLVGEVFRLDITCTADGAYNKKMMFKYSGIRKLDKPGKQLHLYTKLSYIQYILVYMHH